MKREVDIDEISDGRRYHAGDMVKISCNDCKGCSKCCHDMGDSIILDPYDIYQLTLGLGMSFEALMSGDAPYVELAMADGIMLPHISMNNKRKSCRLLSDEGRCRIHDFRPGFCRMFPLGRVYENGSFSYFNQVYECDYPVKSKIKVKKWIGIPNIAEYEKFALAWHDYLIDVRQAVSDAEDISTAKAIMYGLIKRFYVDAYDPARPIYDQIEERMKL